MGDLLGPSDDTDLIKGPDLGTQAAMDAEDFAIDDGSEDQEVEHLAATFPDRGIAVLLLAFFVEAVDLGDLARLMIATDESDTIWVSKCGLSTKCL